MHVEPFIMGNVLNEVDLIVGMNALKRYKVDLCCETEKVKVVTAGERHWLKPYHKVEKTDRKDKEMDDPYISVCSIEALREAH
eukprot:183527-Pelagomonas_calceolata.AAC.1